MAKTKKRKPKPPADKTIELKPKKGWSQPYLHGRECKNWTRSLPYNVNPRGMLVHRVRAGTTFYDVRGEERHSALMYWCGMTVCGYGGIDTTDDPPQNRLLCIRCEEMAIEAGQPTSQELTGRHVHVGSLRAVRECCQNEPSN